MIERLRALIPVDEVVIGARLLWRLPAFLRHPISLAEARTTLRRRFEQREADFLALVRHAIYQHSTSPYRRLLDLAGCTYGDLARLVQQEGVEGALSHLFRHGVYLTIDEFKGRRPVVRGSATFAVDPVRLRNPSFSAGVLDRSSGSRGAGTVVPMNLAFLRDRAVNTRVFLDARGADRWQLAIWAVPGSALTTFLHYARCGARAFHWFSPINPAAPGLHPRYRWSIHALRWASVLAGAPLPRPRLVSLDDPRPIMEWMMGVLQGGGTPHLSTHVSMAVRLCLAAHEAGVELRGAQFSVSGEPLTAARVAVIRRVGAGVVPTYLSTEAGAIGYGCLAPAAPDEVHQAHDLVALIQVEQAAPGLSVGGLLVSSLRPAAPLILLNLSLGDEAVVSRRGCGCPLEQLGWMTHLHAIRSYEKLTAVGMTFLDTAVVRVLEEVLPAHFGGSPTDYQLVEEEAEDGRSRLRLIVHPAIGAIEPDAVAEAFLQGISTGSGAERIMGLVWRDAQLLRVERRVPYATESGKILHLHALQRPPSSPGTRSSGLG